MPRDYLPTEDKIAHDPNSGSHGGYGGHDNEGRTWLEVQAKQQAEFYHYLLQQLDNIWHHIEGTSVCSTSGLPIQQELDILKVDVEALQHIGGMSDLSNLTKTLSTFMENCNRAINDATQKIDTAEKARSKQFEDAKGEILKSHEALAAAVSTAKLEVITGKITSMEHTLKMLEMHNLRLQTENKELTTTTTSSGKSPSSTAAR